MAPNTRVPRLATISDYVADPAATPAIITPAIYDYVWNQGYAEFHYEAATVACEFMAQGHSPRGAAGAIGIPYSSLMRWLVHSEFAHMVDVAAARRVFTLEQLLLQTRDVVKYKVLMAALRRAAPEAWEETRILPSDQNKKLPTNINVTVIQAPARSSMSVVESSISSDGETIN
jgi:hypothetical protein